VKKVSVLMVCRHNICRSPIAEGLLRHYLKQEKLDKAVRVDSAATHDDMLGSRVDDRACKAALKVDVDLGRRKSKKIKPKDYAKFDYILAMDRNNYELLLEQCPPEYISKLSLILSYLDEVDNLDVPDPYYGSVAGFEKVCGLLDRAVKAFADKCLIQLEQ